MATIIHKLLEEEGALSIRVYEVSTLRAGIKPEKDIARKEQHRPIALMNHRLLGKNKSKPQ